MKLLLLAFTAVLLAAFGVQKFEKPTQLVDFQPITKPDQPVELGQVRWLRDFEEAKKAAAESQKPILVLFQEVPGCSTCQRFGSQVLSHPLLVEAIETEFVPLCIFNNLGGADGEVLKKFGEPSWNNPVVRILDEKGERDLIDRISSDWSPHGLADGMLAAMKKRGKTPPLWLENLEKETLGLQNGLAEAVFSMFCFWTGEAKFGEIEGVVATEPGFMHGREVVKIQFDPTAVTYDFLLEKAKSAGCADRAFCEKKSAPNAFSQGQREAAEKALGTEKVAEKAAFRADSEPKYHLSKTAFRHVPMTAMQAARANSLVARGRSPEAVLSPRQLDLKKCIDENPTRKWPDALAEPDFLKAWAATEKIKSGA